MKNQMQLLVVSIGLVAVSATASTINYVVNNGTPYQTPALSTYETSGNMMAGMDVWVSFSNGSVQHAVWAATGSSSGGATVAGFFSMSESGTTFNANAWTLQNLNSALAITSFTLFGVGGDTVFDRTFGGAVGTVGSALGRDFNISGNYSATATYSDILNITGLAAVGDEFLKLQVDFSSSTYVGAHASALFTQDTDNAATRGTITTVADAGSTGLMLGLALMSSVAMKRQLRRLC